MKNVPNSTGNIAETNTHKKPEDQKRENRKPPESEQKTKSHMPEKEGIKKTQPLARVILPANDDREQQEIISPPVPVDMQQTEPDRENETGQEGEIGQYESDTSSQVGLQQVPEPTLIVGKIYKKGELPMSIQQELPDFRISMALYSDDPNSRVAKINGKTLKEGQFLEEGLKLEEIKPDAVIFNYRNYSFQINLR